MHTYKEIRSGGGVAIWTVGYFEQCSNADGSLDDQWRALDDFTVEKNAAAYVNYLNGGDGKLWTPPA